MPDQVLKSMFGNIGTIISFRSSPTDAKRFSDQLGEFPPNQFTQLSRGEVRVRALKDGTPEIPFAGNTSIDHVLPHNKRKQILKYVRERYTRPRADVEADYKSWLRKMMVDPAKRKRKQSDDTFRRQRRQSFTPPPEAQPLHNHTVSERTDIARNNIASILAKTSCNDGLPPRRPPFQYKRNHRFNRRPRTS